MSKKKKVDPIPDEFDSYEEAAEFWDTHDTTDYPDAFRTVRVEAKFKSRRYEIELDDDVIKALKAKARRKKTSLSRLASELLRQQLSSAK